MFCLVHTLGVVSTGCGSSHPLESDSGIDAAVDARPTFDASCPDPTELAPGVLGGDCCADRIQFERVDVMDGGTFESPRYLCVAFSTTVAGSGQACLPPLSVCSDGNVCVKMTGDLGVTARCMSLAECNYIRSVRAEPDDTGVCYYGDVTPVVAGARPEVSCTVDDVAVGLCGNGCECAGDSFVGCFGSSEVHRMGVCAAGVCDPSNNGFGRCLGDQRCMFVAPENWPAFWRDGAVGWDGTVVPPGGCALARAPLPVMS